MLAVIILSNHQVLADVDDRGLYMGLRLLPSVRGPTSG